MSAERILAEAKSWGVITESRAETVVEETLRQLAAALDAVATPRGASTGMVAHLQRSVSRLLAGAEIGRPKR